MRFEPRVELCWRESASSVAAQRDALYDALLTAGAEPYWTEWCANDVRAPRYCRGVPSGAVFVDGRPVREIAPDTLRRALKRRRALRTLAPGLTPAFLLALLPKCPLCFAAYGALASSLGLQLGSSYRWLLAALCGVLLVTVGLLWRGQNRLGASLATIGALVVIAARLVHMPALIAGGLGLLVIGMLISLRQASRQTHTFKVTP